MSASFGSANLFGSAAGRSDPSANAGPSHGYGPQLGLRQRHVNAGANGVGASDENANPNRSSRDDTTAYGKWGKLSHVPAPPRMSLATAAGRSTFHASRTTTTTAQQQATESRPNADSDSNQQALVRRMERNEEEDFSLWVVGYGFRNESQFRVLYHRLQNCGTITARRGGLSCFGEGADAVDKDAGNNWVAVRYESAIHAQKALCQNLSFASVGGSTMVIGVMSLRESDAAARLGIDVRNGPSREVVTLAGSHSNDRRGLRTEADVMLYDGYRRDGIVDGEVNSGLDSFCGKVLAWFFMWGEQT